MAVVEITEKAAVKIVDLIKSEEKDPLQFGLRVGLRGGGCAGYEYVMNLDALKPNDEVFKRDGAQVFIDPKSALFFGGSIIDFKEGLQGAGFVVNNPNSTGSCGCGTSVSF